MLSYVPAISGVEVGMAALLIKTLILLPSLFSSQRLLVGQFLQSKSAIRLPKIDSWAHPAMSTPTSRKTWCLMPEKR